MSPQGSDLVLTTDIPNVEFDVLVGHALDVKAHGRNGSDILVAEFQFVENCCMVLASCSTRDSDCPMKI